MSLDLGNFEDGLSKVNQAISYLIAMPEPQAKRKEVRSTVYYKVAFSLLAEVYAENPDLVAAPTV